MSLSIETSLKAAEMMTKNGITLAKISFIVGIIQCHLFGEALSLQPIGHQVELGGIRGLFRMQGCRLRLTIRSAQEEDALRRILEILGYRHACASTIESSLHPARFPNCRPQAALRELMEPMTEEFGFANIDDYVLRFIEVGRPPDRMPEVDARLHANMADLPIVAVQCHSEK